MITDSMLARLSKVSIESGEDAEVVVCEPETSLTSVPVGG